MENQFIDEKTQKCQFKLNLSGESSISIQSLSKILTNIDILTTESAKNIADCKCEFNIVAINKGSFELVFEGVATVIVNLLNADNINYIMTCLKTIEEWFVIKHHLGLNAPKKIEKTPEGISVTNESGEVKTFSISGNKFFENAIINNSIINIVTALDKSDRNHMSILSTDENPVKFIEIDKNEYPIMTAPIDIRNKDTVYITHVTTDLLLVTAVFNGNAQWGFYFNKRITAKIEDELWLQTFHKSEISLTYGTQMKVNMRIETQRDANGNPIEHTAKYYIEKVISVVAPFDDNMQSAQIEF